MPTKKNMIFLLVILAVLVLNLVPSGVVPDNSMYFKDLEYLGLYNANPFITGELPDVFGTPLNTNHMLLTALRLIPGAVFPNAVLSVLYIAVLILSFIYLCKSAKGYGSLIAITGAFILTAKKYLWHIFTILPFGGIYTFLISAVCIMLAACLRKRITYKSLLALTAVTLLFAMYDNATALCAVIMGGVITALASLLFILAEGWLLIGVPGIVLNLGGVVGVMSAIVLNAIGMVILAKRVKEEFVNSEKTAKAALSKAFKESFIPTINVNVIALIFALLLFAFTNGVIKGFAITFGIGAIVATISTLVFTRMYNALIMPLAKDKEKFIGFKRVSDKAVVEEA